MYTFTTAIGSIGISWNEHGITSLKLRCRKRSETKPPAWVREIVARVVEHLDGQLDEFTDVDIDLSSFTAFEQKVYKVLRQLEPGKTITYGDLAKRAGKPGAARAVGSAMAKNRVPLIIPCHRVIKSDGSLGNYSAPGGAKLKRKLLHIEGV